MDGARVPVEAEERAAQFRTRLAGRQVLILLDDVRGAAQVQPLLPGSASCSVLVTARWAMPELVGSRLIDLDVLPPGRRVPCSAGSRARNARAPSPQRPMRC